MMGTATRGLECCEGEEAREAGRIASWAEIAAWSGQELRPDSDSKDLMVRPDGTVWKDVTGHQRPAEGTTGLADPHLERLSDYLAAATATPDRVWALMDVIAYQLPRETAGYRPAWATGHRRWPWPGRSAERRELARRQALKDQYGVALAGDAYILHGGRFGVGARVRHGGPSYWWPDDRSWLVYTNVDCPTTYVAGSDTLVDQLLADDLLEVVEARLDHPFDGHLH